MHTIRVFPNQPRIISYSETCTNFVQSNVTQTFLNTTEHSVGHLVNWYSTMHGMNNVQFMHNEPLNHTYELACRRNAETSAATTTTPILTAVLNSVGYFFRQRLALNRAVSQNVEYYYLPLKLIKNQLVYQNTETTAENKQQPKCVRRGTNVCLYTTITCKT